MMAVTFYFGLRPGINKLLLDLVDRLLNDGCQLYLIDSEMTVTKVAKCICMMVEKMHLSQC